MMPNLMRHAIRLDANMAVCSHVTCAFLRLNNLEDDNQNPCPESEILKPLTHLIVAVVAFSTFVETLPADLISGSINFAGSMTLDTSSVGTATAITGWIQPQISSTAPSGTFAAAPYALATNTLVAFTSVSLNLSGSAPITNFWNVGGFKFELVSSQIYEQGYTQLGEDGYLVAGGTGIVSGNGFTPTAFTWGVISSDPAAGNNPDSWSFAAFVNSQNTNGAPVLADTMMANATVLSWNDPTFTLQQATNVDGAYCDIPGTTSPYTNPCAGPQQFFRLKQ